MDALEARQERGRQIAASSRILRKSDHVWAVPSQQGGGRFYDVNLEKLTCTCLDCEEGGWMCKHVHAVQISRAITTTVKTDGSVVVKEKMRITYQQNWAAYNAAQTNEKETVQVLLGGLCDGIGQPPQAVGRPRLPLRDVVYGATMKVYTTMSGRRATGDIRSCEEKGHIEHAPHYNTVLSYLARPDLTPLLKTLVEESASPLKAMESAFAVDATGFTTSTFHRWYDHRYGKQASTRKWIKVHAMCGTRTNVITSVEVTEGNHNDCPELPTLLDRTTQRFNVERVSADLGYLSNKNMEAIEAAGALPYIPFKTSSRGDKGGEAWQRLWHLFWYKRREFDQHYHRRSNIETTFSMIKRKFGSNVRAKKYEAQVNEVLCKVLCHNLVVLVHEMHELGVEPSFWAPSATE